MEINESEVADNTGAETDQPDSFFNGGDTLEAQNRTPEEGIPDTTEGNDQHQSESDEGTQPESSEQTGEGNWEERYKNVQSKLTQTSQELADLKKSELITPEIKQQLAIFEKLNQLYMSDQDFAAEINRKFNGQQTQDSSYGMDDGDPALAEIRSLKQEIANLKNGIDSDKKQIQTSQELDNSLASLAGIYKSKFGKNMPLEFENKALEFVQKYGIADPDLMGKALFTDELINAEKQKILDDRKAKANLNKTNTVNANNSTPMDDNLPFSARARQLWEKHVG